ncbi:MAG: ferritin-like domain-containing protein [Cyanobacteriota bacterium]|nr:ferritin-like domain-containing protein [Cyanobacteriota bacterium]
MDGAHPRVLGSLGRALSLELTAVQQYMTQASLLELWGEREAADRFRRETVEEMQHAESLIKHMLALGVAPAASQLRPVTHAADLAGLLQHNLRLEQDLIHLYDDAVRFCLLIGDRNSHALFASLLDAECQHADSLEAWRRELIPERSGYRAWVDARASF